MIYFEEHFGLDSAVSREKQLKGWTRKKKDWLIERFNPDRLFLNDLFLKPFEEFEHSDRLNFEVVRW